LKESLREGFLLELGVPGLNGLFLSMEATAEARKGKQLFGRIPL
jgi:hypothetical protein